MSDWPDGWYRPDTGQPGASQGPYAAPGGRPGAWPEQPPAHGAPGRPARERPGPARPATVRRRRFWGQPGRRGRRIALIAGLVVVVLLVALAGSYIYLDG